MVEGQATRASGSENPFPHLGIRVEPREPAPERSEAQDESPASDPTLDTTTTTGPPVAARGRLRRALLCPYCHDEVGRKDALLCARRGCGALYHRECWHEVLAHYGGCAVYGCESKHARELTVRAYVARVARLFLATLLFPPRVLRAFVHFEEKPAREIHGLVPQRGWRLIREQTVTSSREFVQAGGGALVAALALAVAFVIVPTLSQGILAPGASVPQFTAVWAGLLLLPFAIVLVLVGTFALGIALVRALALVLLAEVNALRRADVSTTTVMSRMRRGQGSKP